MVSFSPFSHIFRDCCGNSTGKGSQYVAKLRFHFGSQHWEGHQTLFKLKCLPRKEQFPPNAKGKKSSKFLQKEYITSQDTYPSFHQEIKRVSLQTQTGKNEKQQRICFTSKAKNRSCWHDACLLILSPQVSLVDTPQARVNANLNEVERTNPEVSYFFALGMLYWPTFGSLL